MYVNIRPTEEMLEQAKLRLVQASVEHLAAVKAKLHIEAALMETLLFQKKIAVDSRVLVNFECGVEECIYEGLLKDDWSQETLVKLRHMTKNGKPCKTLHTYPCSIIHNMKPDPDED